MRRVGTTRWPNPRPMQRVTQTLSSAEMGVMEKGASRRFRRKSITVESVTLDEKPWNVWSVLQGGFSWLRWERLSEAQPTASPSNEVGALWGQCTTDSVMLVSSTAVRTVVLPSQRHAEAFVLWQHKVRFFLAVSAQVHSSSLPSISNAAKWFAAQILRNVLRLHDVPLLLANRRFVPRTDLVEGCLSVGSRFLPDTRAAVSLLQCLSFAERKKVLLHSVLRNSVTDAGMMSIVSPRLATAVLLSDMTDATWEDALELLTLSRERSLRNGEPLPDSLELVVERLLPAVQVPNVKKVLVDIVDGLEPDVVDEISAPGHSATPRDECRRRLGTMFARHGQWGMAYSLLKSTEMCDEINTRGLFEVGDWQEALRFACSSDASERQRELTLRLLVSERRTLLACHWLQHGGPRTTRHETVALLLVQLARKKTDAKEVNYFHTAVDTVIERLDPLSDSRIAPESLRATQIAVASALAACGMWQRVLLLLPRSPELTSSVATNDDSPLSVFVAAASGGAPWDVLKAFITSMWTSKTCASWTTGTLRELLVRCALETGHWSDALNLFAANRSLIPLCSLNHPALLGKHVAVQIPFSCGTFLVAHQWKEALAVESQTGAVPTITRSYCMERPELWEASLRIVSNDPREKIKLGMSLCSDRVLWSRGIEILNDVLQFECRRMQQHIVTSAARNCAAHRPDVAIALLCRIVKRSGGDINRTSAPDSSVTVQEVAAAEMLHYSLCRPSQLTLDLLIRAEVEGKLSAKWDAGIRLITTSPTVRPSVQAFMVAVESFVNFRYAQEPRALASSTYDASRALLCILRLVAPQSGRRKLQGNRSRLVLLFNACGRGPYSSVRSGEKDNDEGNDIIDEVDARRVHRGPHQQWLKAVQILMAPQPASRFLTLPWKQLGHCPPSIVEPLLSTTLQVTTPASIGAWIVAATNCGKWETSIKIIQSASRYGMIPELASLVHLIEDRADVSTRCPEATLSLMHCSKTIRECSPSNATAVFRAFAERSAMFADRSWRGSLSVLSNLSLAGIRHFPPSVIDCIATIAPLPAVRTALQMMDPICVSDPTPIMLEVAAVRRVVESAEAVGLRPQVDVIYTSRSPPNSNVNLNSSEVSLLSTSNVNLGAHGQQGAIKKLYREGLSGLWYVGLGIVASDLGRSTQREVNRVLIMTAFGCNDAAVVAELARRVAPCCQGMASARVAASKSRGNTTHYNLIAEKRSGALRIEKDVMHPRASVVAFCCTAALLAHRGHWEKTLLLVDDLIAEHLHRHCPVPTLLTLVRMSALNCSGRFDDTMRALLSEAVNKNHHRLPVPPREVRLWMKECGLVRAESSFYWWK